MSDGQASALGRCLQRIDASIAALDEIGDTKAGAVARQLVEAVLDLHGLAFAKALAIVQKGGSGDVLAERLADDEYVAAALLLHGLHPEEAEVRLRKKIAAMRPHWGVRGFRVELESVKGSAATARVLWSEDTLDRRAALREIEEALTDAAPDLDEISLNETDRSSPQQTVAALQT
jgi:hypothetical protein